MSRQVIVNRKSKKMNFNKILLVLFLSALADTTTAQVIVNEEASVTRLMETYKSHNLKKPQIRGWRIQVLTTTDRFKMETGMKQLDLLYPQYDYKWEHNNPYYQLRIGAFEKKADLEALVLELKKDFPSALPIQDEMSKREIMKFENRVVSEE